MPPHPTGPLGRWIGLLARGELLPALVIVSAAAMLVLPVPAGGVDVLLSLNVAFALIMLLLAVQAGGALKVGAFPTLLLISTLFRLALNLSTTRLILAEGDAGHVVRAFGSFVAAGNPLVGGVLFLILTVVQFIVIAKGAERVAEVTARFTLDALPGKQMSIDADLRAGAIDQPTAGQRRSELEREAQFHGAMDGAMKFVKGDAMAGMAITAVNLLGGLLIGCVQRGLPIGEALERYTLLTIGDGLVSQIPALLVSVAAGLVVTRVRAAQAEQGLGRQVAGQLCAHPEVLVFGGLALTGIGLTPGMPLAVFGPLGALLVGSGVWLARRRRTESADRVERAARPTGCSLTVRLADPGEHRLDLRTELERVRTQFERELGFGIPALEPDWSGPVGRWSLLFDEVPVAGGRLSRQPSEAWLQDLAAGLRRCAARLIGVQETQDLLDALERSQPALVREVVPRLVPTVLLAEILARLVEEQVPIRDLRGILACLAEWARSEADPMVLAERVRENQRAIISHRLAPDGDLTALVLDPAVERLIAAGLDASAGGGAQLALDPADGQAILAGLERVLGRAGEPNPVVICRPGLRRPFWKLISPLYPAVRVISFLELEPSLTVRPTDRIALAATGAAGGRA